MRCCWWNVDIRGGTIAAANQLMHHDGSNLRDAAVLAAVPELSPSWKKTLCTRVDTGALLDDDQRLEGGDGRDSLQG